MQPSDVIAFWMDAGPASWFAKSEAFDAAIRNGFEAQHHAAARGELNGWATTQEGATGLLLLLDQFPRNIYRGSAHAFATDPLARAMARQALEHGFDRTVETSLRPFFYLPFEHSESLTDQDRAVALFEGAKSDRGGEDNLKWAILHRDIIVRFGRFPHRNMALGRQTTAAEQAFLNEGGFAG